MIEQIASLTDRKLKALERQASAMERMAKAMEEAVEEALPMLALIVEAINDDDFHDEPDLSKGVYLDGSQKG